MYNVPLCRDEQKARDLGLTPQDVERVVNMSMEEFNVWIVLERLDSNV